MFIKIFHDKADDMQSVGFFVVDKFGRIKIIQCRLLEF